jgi:hypothetical protein
MPLGRTGCWLCHEKDDTTGCTCQICKGERLCNPCYYKAMEYLNDPFTPPFNGRKRLAKILWKWPTLADDSNHPLRDSIEGMLRDWLLNIKPRQSQVDKSDN